MTIIPTLKQMECGVRQILGDWFVSLVAWQCFATQDICLAFLSGETCWAIERYTPSLVMSEGREGLVQAVADSVTHFAYSWRSYNQSNLWC